MARALLVEASPGEMWAALVEDGAPVELRLLRDGAGSLVGEIRLGRIVELVPALPAALVDVGLERPAFLSAEDAVPGKGIAALHVGQAVVVQVMKDARADKAAGVTLRPRLMGALLHMVPGRKTALTARADAAERRRLLDVVGALTLPGEAFHIRDAARGAAPEALAADAARLRARSQAIETERARAKPPARLEPETPPLAALVDAMPPPDRIVIDDRAAFNAARAWLVRHRPELAPRLALHGGQGPLFEDEGVAEAIAAALAPRVLLPGGGAITIETTAAAVTIDVDSAGAAPMAANLAAAGVAARQIRLRSLAGPIVIDFIAMRSRADRERVRATLAAALAGDPAAPELLGWTRLGHIELVRPRRHPALDELLYEHAADGGRIKTALTVALEALKALARAEAAAPGRAHALHVADEVAAALAAGEARAARLALEARLGRAVTLVPEPGRPRATFDIA